VYYLYYDAHGNQVATADGDGVACDRGKPVATVCKRLSRFRG
jgi:hypothetical protein